MYWKHRKNKTEQQIQEYTEELGINELTATVFCNRHIDLETAKALFNSPEELLNAPEKLQNIRQAAEKILEYTDSETSEIWVFADYDVDGLAAGYIMTDFLRGISKNGVYVYYPNRDEGYGLNMDFCITIADRLNAVDIDKILVITVDNGIACHEEINFLRNAGIETVVLDHHLPGSILPDCIIVDPHTETESIYNHLAGCAVALKVVQFIDPEKAKKYYFAAALGTIADIMPAHFENQGIIRLGLEQLNASECPRGFKILRQKLLNESYNTLNISWTIAPLLNACGRMGDIDKAAALFFSDGDSDEEIIDLILEMIELNEQRKDYTKQAQKELDKIDFTKVEACFFDASRYHAGICGPLAGSLAERFNKPAFVYTVQDDIVIGSARSSLGIDLEQLLSAEKHKKHILDFGGHNVAAGFSLDKSLLKEFQESSYLYIYENKISAPADEEIEVDCTITLGDLNRKNYTDLNSIYYDIPPVFALKNVRVKDIRYSQNNKDNVCLTLQDNSKSLSIWAWRKGELYKQLGSPKTIDLAGYIDKEFMKNGITLNVVDLRKPKKTLGRAAV